jgi:polar amino acid transport system substrate-binding protein
MVQAPCAILAYVRKAATIALGICLCTSACAGTDANAPDSPSAVPVPQQEAALAKLVPISVAQDGALTVATDPTYPPLEFLSDTGEVQGAEIDLVVAISTVLGLEPEFEQEAFTAIPGAVRSGRYELGVAALALRPDTPRLNNAVINLRSGSQLVRSKSAANVTLDSLCGVGVAALEGSLQI